MLVTMVDIRVMRVFMLQRRVRVGVRVGAISVRAEAVLMLVMDVMFMPVVVDHWAVRMQVAMPLGDMQP